MLSSRRVIHVALLALVALAGAAAAPAPGRSAGTCTAGSAWGTNRPDLAGQVVALVNAHRASLGQGSLAISSPLTASSEWKSLHMAGNGYFGHDDPAPPVARSAHARALDCGYGGSRWGENIAYGYGSAQAVMTGWLGSSGHRANIENASFTSIGVGVAQRTGGTLYWTQNFGNDAAAPPPPSPPPASPPPPSPPAPSAPAPATPAPPAPGTTTPSAPTPAPASGVPAAASPAASATPQPTPRARGRAIGALPARTSRARARTRLVAAVPFVRLDDNRPVVTGDIRCRASLAGRRLQVVARSFRAGRATCVWVVPRDTASVKLRGLVTLQLDDMKAARRFERVVT